MNPFIHTSIFYTLTFPHIIRPHICLFHTSTFHKSIIPQIHSFKYPFFHTSMFQTSIFHTSILPNNHSSTHLFLKSSILPHLHYLTQKINILPQIHSSRSIHQHPFFHICICPPTFVHPHVHYLGQLHHCRIARFVQNILYICVFANKNK